MRNYIKAYKRIGIVSLVIFIIGGIAACTGDFTDINTPKYTLNTNNLGPQELGAAFAQMEYGGIKGYYQVPHNLYAGAWSQYFAIIHPSFPSSQFVQPGVWNTHSWQGWYGGYKSGSAVQLHFLVNYTKKHDLSLANAIIKVWKVELYDRITDFWGPIPYSQYGNGKTSVSYDSQDSIYLDMFKKLDDAVKVLKNHEGEKSSLLASSDLVYGGKADEYLKWANSLRLRLAIRISYVDPKKAEQEAEKAMQNPGGVITSNADNALMASTPNSHNQLSGITYHTEFVMGATMTSILNGYHDPRRSVYMQPCCGRIDPTGSTYVGERNVDPNRNLNMGADFSYVGKQWLPVGVGGSDPPEHLMEASEVYFLRAEGALRGWPNMGGTAEELYNKGIRASLKARTDATDQEIKNYIHSTSTPAAPHSKDGGPDAFNSPPVSNIPVIFETNASFETKLEQIITQKWIALYPDAWEAWAERRRTGYPRGYAIIKSNNPNISSTQLVRRIKYPPSEYDTNAKAVKAAVDSLLGGPDQANTRLWWDAKPLADYPTPTDPIQ